ncbi:MAG: hypothetical protein IPG76_04085 [Acidobacteria bacterium]|nr:hypothetical protein [Acidobacteriota bacterium]
MLPQVGLRDYARYGQFVWTVDALTAAQLFPMAGLKPPHGDRLTPPLRIAATATSGGR